MDGNSAEEIQAIKAFWWAGPSGIGMKKKHTKASVHNFGVGRCHCLPGCVGSSVALRIFLRDSCRE